MEPRPAPRDVAPTLVPLALGAAPTPSPLDSLGAPRLDFDRTTAAISIAGAARSAGACLAPEDAARTARAHVTFSTSGRVTSATVDGAFMGTATGACIARALRGAHVHAFEGESVTVATTVHL